MSIIYEPQGKAAEYSPLAVNLFTGCPHRCSYCYGPAALHRTPEVFHGTVEPRKDILKKLEREAIKMAGDPREILLCFVCDPYPPDGKLRDITRQALTILGENNLKVTVLTKGGMRAAKDFDLLKKHKFSFGTSIVWYDTVKASAWEPKAALIESRIEAIKKARLNGIKTWVSLEPIIEPTEALAVLDDLYFWVDHWKIGKINHDKILESKVNWGRFLKVLTGRLDYIKADYYIKDSLKIFDLEKA